MKSSQSADTKDKTPTVKDRLRSGINRGRANSVKKLPVPENFHPLRSARQVGQTIVLKRLVQTTKKLVTAIGVRRIIVAVPVGLVTLPYVKRRIGKRMKGRNKSRRHR